MYFLGKSKDSSLRGFLSSPGKLLKSKGSEFWALKDINLEIEAGDVVGIIGKNGAGKSTLLKILSQITSPTKGRIEINGRVASLLEVGTGFHPELTGRENIYLNGTILGMTRKEVKDKFDEIVAFSGVEKFIDTPVKHYSSGMYVRLAFAVAAHLEPEILIIDEVLAVGDAEFQKKCLGKMKEVAGQGRTVLFVSHHLGSVRQLCNKGVLLEGGEIKLFSDINSVISNYQKRSQNKNEYFADQKDKEIYISFTRFLNGSNSFYHDERIAILFSVKQNVFSEGLTFLLIRILNEHEQVIGSSEIKISSNKSEYTYTIPDNTLTKGRYKINAIIYRPAIAQFDNVQDCLTFEILDNNSKFAHLETFDIGDIYLSDSWE